MLNGIDVSAWQGDINWKKVKDSGVEAVILKAGGSDDGFYTDSKFEANYKGAKEVGLKVGAYYFVGSQFVTRADGEADALRFLNIIKGKQFDMPVYVDVEATRPEDKEGATNATSAFCLYMEQKGYFVGIYASEVSGFRDRLNDSKLGSFTHWVACYGDEEPAIKYGGWQYSSSGKVNGIDGNVDMDKFEDYSDVIIKGGFNGYANKIKKEAVLPTKKVTEIKHKSNDDIANEVLKGLWGNGDDRKAKLEKAGYNYDAVQNIVNKKVQGVDGYKIDSTYTVVTPCGLNIRKSADKSSAIVGTISAGKKVSALDILTSRDYTWFKTADGYICAREGNERYIK